MKKPVQWFKGDQFFGNQLPILVNRYPEDFKVPLHAHDFIEFNFVAEGKGFHHIGDDIVAVSKGLFFMIPVGVPHVFRPTSPDPSQHPLIVYNCLFAPQLLHGMSAMFMFDPLLAHYLDELQNGQATYHSIQDHDGSIEKLLVAMYQEFSFSAAGASTYLYTLLVQLVITIHRLRSDDHPLKIKDVSHFNMLIQFMEQHVHEELTLAKLATRSGWSVRHLQRLFLQHTGQTFGSYLNQLRIQKSCEHLRLTQLKISTIAEMVGYSHIDSFNALFKKRVGQTPGQYRKQFR
ncbi:AraC family transcriptional regulator, L-rhamnose operon transcriptional activator RhaR [Paenibacillus algorifonticola]|uniref:AraC family transcriptional regulator, L-rhamnose operon transcriptional activator RhaR n=2 Tax=Paenibacillus algorifonticola TaxID=684063 RepID=A0A1I1YS99_9BACL|nr:AraC family transcriptional regulator, L-rhamnose operon transcriptional activator RhaR [Paenibacillus algorifonticola]